MKDQVQLHGVVALLGDTPIAHFESGEPLLLRRGQMGTVVMIYGDGTCEVEFADRGGRTYALLTLPADKLMVLRETPEHAAV